MKIKEIINYNSDTIKNNNDLKNIKTPKFIHNKLSHFNKYRKSILTMNNISLKKNIFQFKKTISKENKNILSIKNIKFPNTNVVSNNNNNINCIYLSNPSQNYYNYSLTERNNIHQNKKRKNMAHKSQSLKNIIFNNNSERIYNGNNNNLLRKKNPIFMRKIDLELNDILNNKNLNSNLKIIKTNIKNKKNIINNFNNIINNKNPNIYDISKYKNKTVENNFPKIKKNKSEKILNNISRKVLYLNQKNNVISEKNIINLIQKEEKTLKSNFSDTYLNEFHLNNYNNKKYKSLLPLVNDFSLNLKNKKYINKNSINNKCKIKLNSNENLLSDMPTSKEKTKQKSNEVNINSKNINLVNEKRYCKDQFSSTDYIYDKNNIDIKTVYDELYDDYEFEDNIDNYDELKEKKYRNYYNNYINQYNYKNNNNLNSNIQTNYNNTKDTNLNNMVPENKNLSKNSIQPYNGKIKINKNNLLKENKSLDNNKSMSYSLKFKKVKRKSQNNDLIGYLSNYNFTSQNFFVKLLKENKKQDLQNEIKEKDINNKNFDKNNIKKSNIKRSIKYWNIKTFNKNKINEAKNNYHKNKIKKEISQDDLNGIKKNNSINLNDGEELSENKNISKNELDSKNDYENKEQPPNYNKPSFKNFILENNNKSNNLNDEEELNKNNDEKNEEIKRKNKNTSLKRFNTKIYGFNKKESNNSPNKKVNFTKGYTLKRLKTRNYQYNRLTLSNNSSKNNFSKSKTKSNINNTNKDYNNDDDDDDEDNTIEENLYNNNNLFKRKYSLNHKISFKDLSFLDNNKMNVKEKLKLIKKYKDKAIENIYTIVKDNIEEKKELSLSTETLIQLLIIKSYKKYVNIMKLLTERGRALSGLNPIPSNENDIKDEEIIKYLYRIFSDESSSYYLVDKSKNKNNNDSIISNSFFPNFYLGKLSHKKYLFMNEMRNSEKKRKTKKKTKKFNKNNIFLTKFKKPIEENKKELKNFKQFIYEEISPDKQRQLYLSKKIKLTNELKYQIEITPNERGRDRFQNLLKQIESMKNENIKDYMKYINEDYNFFQGEINDLINDREKEERINNFLLDLIDDRNNISRRKKTLEKKIHLEDNKFETIMGEEYFE